MIKKEFRKPTTKKLLAALLCAAVTVTAVPAPAMTARAESKSTQTLRGATDFVLEGKVLVEYKGKGGSVVVPDGITCIGQDAFYDCTNVTSVTLPESVTSIDISAFEDCTRLTSIVISGKVKEIGYNAFAGCSSLSSITIPASVAYIGGDAFCGTPWLAKKRKENPLVVVNNILIDGKSVKGSVVIPKGVTAIGEDAFSDCSKLTSVTIPDGMLDICEYAFSGCSNLRSVTIPASVGYIGDGAFDDDNKKLTFYGAANSLAQASVKSNGLPFVVIDSKGRRYISSASVTIKPFTYTGKAIKPTTKQMTVKLGRETLVYGRDYKITKCANNTNPGTAKVTIVGIGNHISTKTVSFKINLGTPGSVKQSARTTSSIKLSWKKVTGATSYVVYRAPYGSKKFKKIATVKGTSYTNKKLTAGQYYLYRVRAYRSKSASAYSKTVTAHTSLSAPFISKVTSPKKKQAVVTWKKTKGATGYQVYRATSKKGKYKKVATVKSAKYTDKKVSRKKTYYYKVRAYRKVKGKIVYSGYSKVKGTKVK